MSCEFKQAWKIKNVYADLVKETTILNFKNVLFKNILYKSSKKWFWFVPHYEKVVSKLK